jgi:hypothetical protein
MLVCKDFLARLYRKRAAISRLIDVSIYQGCPGTYIKSVPGTCQKSDINSFVKASPMVPAGNALGVLSRKFHIQGAAVFQG